MNHRERKKWKIFQFGKHGGQNEKIPHFSSERDNTKVKRQYFQN